MVLILGGGRGSYRLEAVVQNAGQLVKGNLVTVGGVRVGQVTAIELTDRNLARVVMRIDDGALTPLHRGTTATIRSTSLSSVAGRQVALAPGPNDAAAVPDGGTITLRDTRPIVEIDELLNTLDAQTRSALQQVVHGGAVQFGGHLAAANRGLEALDPALSQTVRTTDALLADQGALERFVVQAAAVVGAVAPRDAALEQGIVNGATVARAIAGETASLQDTLDRAPALLRRSNSTLVDLRATLRDAQPALREARPVSPRLARLLRRLEPLTRRARPVVADVRGILGDLRAALEELPATDRIGRPALESATSALGASQHIVAAARPYVPDVVAGLLNGFGGTTGGYYDANGHYARIGLQGNPASGQGAGSNLAPQPGNAGGLDAFQRDVLSRCPGAAQEAGPDGSNPWAPPEAPCKPGEQP